MSLTLIILIFIIEDHRKGGKSPNLKPIQSLSFFPWHRDRLLSLSVFLLFLSSAIRFIVLLLFSVMSHCSFYFPMYWEEIYYRTSDNNTDYRADYVEFKFHNFVNYVTTANLSCKKRPIG